MDWPRALVVGLGELVNGAAPPQLVQLIDKPVALVDELASKSP